MTLTADRPAAVETPSARTPLPGRWPLAGAVAAVALGAFPMIGFPMVDEDVYAQGPAAVYDAVKDNGAGVHIGMSLAFIGVVALALFSTGFLRFLKARTPQDSQLAGLARIGMTSAIALTVMTASFRAIYRGGLPDHGDHTFYSESSVPVLLDLVGQLQYVGLWPLLLVMGATAALGLRHRTLPRWYAGLSVLFCVASFLATVVVGLPYSAGLVGPLWLLASSVVVLRHRDRAF